MNKHKIMEALLSPNNNLTQEDIAWASANIPNETINEPLVFNHEQGSIFEACGMGPEVCKEIKKEYDQLRNAKEFDKKSQVIEHIINNGSNKMLTYVMIRGIIAVETDKEEMLDQLKKLLDKL